MRGAWLPLVLAFGCSGSEVVECGDGVVCGPDRVCATVTWQFTAPATAAVDEAANFCVEQAQLDACTGVADGGACNGIDNATCHSGVCLPSDCGNHRVDAGEDCDDSNLEPGDDCSSRCRLEICGNAVIDAAQGEQCDDANFADHDGCSSSCQLETLDWHLVAPPPPGYNIAAAYDAARDKVVMFDGSTGEVYEWDGVWRHTTPSSKPSPREFYALTYAPELGGVVVHGGTDPGAGLFLSYGSLYVWNGVTWRVLPSGPALHRHSMAWDPRRKRLVAFGGRTANEGSVRTVWEFDGSTWTDVTPADMNNAPSPSIDSAMAYDPKQGLIVLYLVGTFESETWEYDGTTWTKQAVTTPEIRRPRMTYVAGLGRAVVYGGIIGGTITSTIMMWTGSDWDIRGPFAGRDRLSVAMSDDGRSRMITFGGCNAHNNNTCSVNLGDTAFYDGTNWAVEQTPPSYLSVAAAQGNAKIVRIGGGTNVGGPPGTSNFTWELTRRGWTSYPDGPGANDSPPPLFAAQMVHDSQRDQFVLFGGLQSGSVMDTRTWIRTNTTWALMPTTSPPGRAYHSMAYDKARGATVVFGGMDDLASVSVLDDTWVWNGSAWTEVTTPGPSARAGAAMGYDYENDLIVLFGGFALPGPDEVGDVWVFDGTKWTELTNRVGEHPPVSMWPSLSWDHARGRLLLTGGFQQPFDTWEWDGNATESRWKRVSTLRIPPPHYYDTTVPSPDGSGITVLAGAEVSGNAIEPTTQLWELRSTGHRGADGCVFALDADGDTLTGCEDDDCWATCSPGCPPATSCPAGAPGCGDGVCSSLESCQTCASDCPTCNSVCGDFICDPNETCPGDCP